MYKITVINNVNGRQFGATFETQEEAQSWRDKQIAKESWGKNAYSTRLPEDTTPLEGFVSSQACVLQEAIIDSITEEVLTEQVDGIEYFYEVEYTITEEDLSLNADYVRSMVLAKRQEEYSKIDNLLKEALVEKELGDSNRWDEYVLLRAAIKADNPL